MAEFENGNGNVAEAEKAAVDDRAIDRSHIQPRTEEEGPWAPSTGTDLIFFLASAADQFYAWGRNPKMRDKQLREFWPTENMFASAVASLAMRNAAFSWDIEGPPRTAARVHDLLLNADMGEGWMDFMVKLSLDLYTQDNGAFIEIVRQTDSPDAPVIAINHLDSWRCWHTGIREAPVVYQDRTGKNHLLKWYEVATLAEVPAPIETLYGLQYSALTRVLTRCQIQRNISIYQDEKTGGRHTRALHLVRGVSTAMIQQALSQGQLADDNRGQIRFASQPVLGSVDPAVELQHEVIDFVSLPDNYSEEEALKWYLVQIALAFGVDYQDLAPLPGGNLGTSAQSQILHLKSRGKGPASFMKLVAHVMNQLILPGNVEFVWSEQDEEAEKTNAEIKQLRAEERKTRIESGEITPQIARMMAHDDGDLEEEYLQLLGDSDATTDVSLEDERQVDPQLGGDRPPRQAIADVQQQQQQQQQNQPPGNQPPQRFAAREKELVDALVDRLPFREKTRLAEFLQTRIHKAFTMAADDLAALGYMDTEERIALSGVIGDALKWFALDTSERLPEAWDRYLDQHDIREIIEGLKETLAEEAVMQVTPERKRLDEEMAERLGPLLKEMQAEAAKKLTASA